MSPDTGRTLLGRGRAGVCVSVVVLCGLGLAGCGIVSTVKNVANNVENNKNVIDSFTSKMTSGQTPAFEATYVTTGSSPALVVYAVQPPKDLSFQEITSGGSTGSGGVDLIVNSSGEFACTPSSTASSSASGWTCRKLGTAQAAIQNQILGLYTPAHWAAFLQAFSLAAGIAGDQVTTSTMTVNGFGMQCIDFRASGISGTSTICTTAQGLLGYVKVASETTSFEIKSFTASPPASLFELPPGATLATG